MEKTPCTIGPDITGRLMCYGCGPEEMMLIGRGCSIDRHFFPGTYGVNQMTICSCGMTLEQCEKMLGVRAKRARETFEMGWP